MKSESLRPVGHVGDMRIIEYFSKKIMEKRPY
jgi:hypothetical protein